MVKAVLRDGTPKREIEYSSDDGFFICKQYSPLVSCSVELSDVEFLNEIGREEDLISIIDKNRFFRACKLSQAKNPILLITANDPTSASQVAKIKVPELDSDINFDVLDNTPPVVSVGKRCMEEDYGFYWKPYSTPVFVKPDGTKIRCKMRGRVPVFGGSTFASPTKSQANSGAQALPSGQPPEPAKPVADADDLDSWLQELRDEGI